MARQKTNKTAAKRFKATKPRGAKSPKILYNISATHHFRTKKSARQKRRKPTDTRVDATIEKNLKQLIVNVSSIR